MKLSFKIISGGQTGVDRAALEWALGHGIPHGGWCPRGRKAEDGVIPLKFQLKETGGQDYSLRTRRNVRDSGGTVIFSKSGSLGGGSKETADHARKIGKPLLRLVSSLGAGRAATQLGAFLKEHGIRVLNVAGPRASEEPGTGRFVQAVLSRALKSFVQRPEMKFHASSADGKGSIYLRGVSGRGETHPAPAPAVSVIFTGTRNRTLSEADATRS